jgi:hypothetical protein
MRVFSALVVGLLAALSLCAQEKEAPQKELEGVPPRATPGDYQAHAQAGTVSIGAEFLGHFIPTSESTLTTSDYVAVETGVFGTAGSHLKLSYEDFSLRINDKKSPVRSEPYGAVFRSLKDPELEPPASANKPKTTVNGGGDPGGNTPAPVHIPIEVQRAMQQRVQKTWLPQGDRALPQGGLLFFPYRGKTEHIESLELIYDGPAGKATLALQP